ncbi:pyridoxal phosphate-dependent decarboxylase family protein [Brucella pituitosa]|uniref:Aspartate aminotransferase family protein n=1 Tax=Brucella pituitosa TaxID=571256 RepID=A0ABS3K2M0_9HYPH|nr:aminotransferase class I/II-fold pyridoxal phosphate-dependent enzyme [Brucella pituitosa]MBO1041167.1 aspartate aminotransferase family protein [Brucella pituitosa]
MNILRNSQAFPEKGISEQRVKSEMEAACRNDIEWFSLKNLTASYYGGEDIARIAKDAFVQHIGDNVVHQNGLHPSVALYEREVLEMTLNLFSAPIEATGTITTGGSESIALALKAARDRARALKGITKPQIVIPKTAYAVFNKLCHLMNIDVVQIDSERNFAADPVAMAKAVNENTIMLVGSAPPFPHANVDPIREIAEIASERGIWMHVDACIGGFVLPFAKMLGEDVPDFDFSVPGVTSISSDYHKYGYAYRGCSALLLRDKSLQEWQTFSTDAWPAGNYASRNMAGSRNSGPIASAWAVMKYLGVNGYKDRVAGIIAGRRAFKQHLEQIDGVQILGTPQGPHFSFTIGDVDVLAVADGLMAKGWGINIETKPPAILLMLSAQHVVSAEPFAADLANVMETVSGRAEATNADPVAYGIY